MCVCVLRAFLVSKEAREDTGFPGSEVTDV